jgi:hypothetical protein
MRGCCLAYSYYTQCRLGRSVVENLFGMFTYYRCSRFREQEELVNKTAKQYRAGAVPLVPDVPDVPKDVPHVPEVPLVPMTSKVVWQLPINNTRSASVKFL